MYDPPDLDAGFPVTSRSVLFGDQAEPPLLGFSKDRPSIVLNRRVRFQTPTPPALPRGCTGLRGTSCRSSRVRSRGFTPPQRFPPLRPCRSVSPCCRSWGSLRFTSPSGENPRSAFLPFEAFPPLKAFAAARVCDVLSFRTPTTSRVGSSLEALGVTALLPLSAFLPPA